MNGIHNILDIIEGFHLANGIKFLHEKNVLTKLKKRSTIEELVKGSDIDPSKLRELLWYVSSRTEIILRDDSNGNYSLSTKYHNYRDLGFWIEQYLGAYDFNSDYVAERLTNCKLLRSIPNQEKHAHAYQQLNGCGFPFLSKLIRELNAEVILELGCGTGELLVDIAKNNPATMALGIDNNPFMLHYAQKRIHAENLQQQIKVASGNAACIDRLIPETVARKFELIIAVSLINEFCDNDLGNKKIIKWLRLLKQTFPRGKLLIVDYYGRLGRSSYISGQKVLLHDWIQLMSGQGIPPENLSQWKKIYNKSKCSLLDVLESPNSEIPYFVHLLEL